MTPAEQKIYNQAVKATLIEVSKFDGIIPKKEVRIYLCDNVWERVAYKNGDKKPNIKPRY